MLKTIWAVAKEGKFEPLEDIEAADGMKVLVTLFEDNDKKFWLNASQSALDAIWNNSEDDVYEKLLQE